MFNSFFCLMTKKTTTTSKFSKSLSSGNFWRINSQAKSSILRKRFNCQRVFSNLAFGWGGMWSLSTHIAALMENWTFVTSQFIFNVCEQNRHCSNFTNNFLKKNIVKSAYLPLPWGCNKVANSSLSYSELVSILGFIWAIRGDSSIQWFHRNLYFVHFQEYKHFLF